MRALKAGLAAAAIACICLTAYPAMVYLKKFTFDEDKALDQWRKMVLNGEVRYTLVKEGGQGFIDALSEKTCSALYYRISFNLRDYPLLNWKWRVLKFPEISPPQDEHTLDDYAARVYVIFPFLTFSSSKFIEYVWAEDIPVGTILSNPTADNVKMIVIRSGRPRIAEWVSEGRNVYEDYVKAFGEEPRLKAGAIAIMCDADNSKTEAQSLFDDIVIATQTGLKRRLE